MELYSLPHSDSVEVGISFKWTTIHCLTQIQWGGGRSYKQRAIQDPRVRVWEMDSFTNGQLFTSLQWECRDGRSYKWTTIYCFTVTVRIWPLLEVDHYPLVHSNSAEMDALTNLLLCPASQLHCSNGCFYKWTNFYCVAVRVREMDVLTNVPLLTVSHRQYEVGRSYKCATIHSLKMRVRRWTLLYMDDYSLPHNDNAEMDSLPNGPLFFASKWQFGRWTLLEMYHYSLPHSVSAEMDSITNGALITVWQWECQDGRSYKRTTIPCLTSTVPRWTLLQIEHYPLSHSDSAEITNGAIFTAS